MGFRGLGRLGLGFRALHLVFWGLGASQDASQG